MRQIKTKGIHLLGLIKSLHTENLFIYLIPRTLHVAKKTITNVLTTSTTAAPTYNYTTYILNINVKRKKKRTFQFPLKKEKAKGEV